MSVLLGSSTAKDYALRAARDGVISYGVSSSHGATREQWFDEIFGSLSQQLGISFVKEDISSAELRFDVENISRDEFLNLDGGEPSLVIDRGDGLFLWKSAKDTRQYGGVQDQLTVNRSVLRSLGLSYPGGSPWNQDVQTTIMSHIRTSEGLYGHTFSPAVADIDALHQLYGRKPVLSQRSVDHFVVLDEELVVALDGQVDYIYLSLKGIDAANQSSILYDELGPIYNDYRNSSIAGFNPWEGDVIFIERTLLSPYDGNDAKTSEWVLSQELSKDLFLTYSGVPDSEYLVRRSDSEVIYNDAGKVMLNVNSVEEGLGPVNGVNNYLVAFLDLGGVVTRELPFGAFKTYALTGGDPILGYGSATIDQSREYSVSVEGESLSRAISGDSLRSQSAFSSSIQSNFAYLGSDSSESLLGSQGANGQSWAHDFFDAGAGDDFIGGGGGRDVMIGGFGNDELRGGYGHDVLDGGAGADILYGGGGRNTFNNNNDGEFDQLFILSDYHSHNQPTGRLHNGANADTISSLGVEDRITILGATTDELSIRQLNDGLGIFASGSLEAIVTDSNWTAAALGNNVFGDASRFW